MSDTTGPAGGRGGPRRRRPAHTARPPAGATPGRRASPTQARIAAVRILERVDRAGAYADLALHAALRHGALSTRDRAFVTELVYGTLRWRGRLDFLLSFVLERDFSKLDPRTASLLRVGAYQIVFGRQVPAAAAVDQSVRCARALGVERVTGLVNAVLRRLSRQHETIPLPDLEADPVGHLTHALSLPSWLAERWLAWLGAEPAAQLAAASNQVPPLTVRTNPLRSSREALVAELLPRFPEAAPGLYAPWAVQLGHRGNPAQDPAFLAGRFTVQDEASQLVVELLDPQPGECVLDCCAAPGTKTTAIAERMQDRGEVLGLDRHGRRLGLLGRDARRLGLGCIRTREHDASQPLPPGAAPGAEAAGGFDRVLVDAPCSGLGTLRRNPDARWRLQDTDPERLAESQLAILRRAAAAMGPRGTLVYSTCTLLPEENEGVIAAFLAEAQDFRLLGADELPPAVRPLLEPAAEAMSRAGLAAGSPIEEGSFLRTWPHRHGADGFFAARLERRQER